MVDEAILMKCRDINKEILFLQKLRTDTIKSIDDAINIKNREIQFLLSGECNHGNFLFDKDGNGQCDYCKQIIPFELIQQQQYNNCTHRTFIQ